MNSKNDIFTTTENGQFYNLTYDGQDTSMQEPYIPYKTEDYLGVRNSIFYLYI